MRNNFTKILFVIFTAIGMLGFSGQAKAVVDQLVVEFENTPLFSEANFLPGGGITRWVKVINTSGATQRIATQPLNITDPNHLGGVLNLVIKEGDKTLYNNALSDFLANGEVYLSDLANGINTQYDFTVSFYSGAQNTFQGKTLKFDILVGFQGTDGGILPGAGSTSGGGGGGWLPPGLTIQNETENIVTATSVIITWLTSYAATSQVIYALGSENHTLDLTDVADTPPKYGYQYTTSEFNTPANTNGVLSHSVTISGLTAGTTYYYRAVSHGSLAISTEHSFTTLMPGGEVAGATTERGQETGGLLGGGGGVFVAAAETTGPTESISPTPVAGIVAGESTCSPIWWWFLGYVLLFIILGTVQKMKKRVSAGGIVLQIVLLIAALLWWWFEPCGVRFWVWPVLILIVFLVSLRFYLKKSSDQETPV